MMPIYMEYLHPLSIHPNTTEYMEPKSFYLIKMYYSTFEIPPLKFCGHLQIISTQAFCPLMYNNKNYHKSNNIYVGVTFPLPQFISLSQEECALTVNKKNRFSSRFFLHTKFLKVKFSYFSLVQLSFTFYTSFFCCLHDLRQYVPIAYQMLQ